MKNIKAFTVIFILMFVFFQTSLSYGTITDGYPSADGKIHMVGGKNGKKLYVGFILNRKERQEDILILNYQFSEAYLIYKKQLEDDDIYAYHNLGLMYLRGLGVQKDLNIAKNYLQISMQKLENYNTANIYYQKAQQEIESNQTKSEEANKAQEEAEALKILEYLKKKELQIPKVVSDPAIKSAPGKLDTDQITTSLEADVPTGKKSENVADPQTAQVKNKDKSKVIANSTSGKFTALVIGNGKYRNASWLLNPANDAAAMKNKLVELGFDVIQGIDLDKQQMDTAIRSFLQKSDQALVSIFFYAGHGMQVDGKNYLIPVDAKIDSPADLNFATLDLEKILINTENSNRANIIFLDACRDNPFTRTFAARNRSIAVGYGLAPYTSFGTGTLIAYSTSPGKTASDGKGKNSPFTAALVKYLGTPQLEIRQVLTRVRAEVAESTDNQQIPWDNSSLRGDIFLAGSP